MKRSIVWAACLWLLSAIAVAQVPVTRGPYLQKVTSSSIIVRWRTASPTVGVVRYGSSPSLLSQTVSESASTTDHSVELTGLAAHSTYYYGIGDGTNWHTMPDSNYRFTTFPAAGDHVPLRMWATGDFGKGNAEQRSVMQSFLDFNQYEAPDVWLWLGDNAYDNGTDTEFQDKVFDSTNAYGTIFPFMPFQPCPGNHDYMTIAPPFSNSSPSNHSGPYFDLASVYTNGESGGVPSGTELYYSFNYGNVHFVSLNSEIGCLTSSSNDWIGTFPYINPFAPPFTGSAFTQWLNADLSANTQRWTIIYFHQPPYTDGSHDATSFWEVYMKAMRENIVPIFEQYDVDLVLCGHSHVYERSYLIHGHYDDASTFNPSTMLIDGSSGTDSLGEAYVKDLAQPNGELGTVYVVCGNSGSKDDNPPLQYPAMYFGYGCDTCVGSMVVDVHGDTLHGRYLSAYGDILDDFTLYKLNGATGTATGQPSGISMNVFPNPNGGNFEVEILGSRSLQGSVELVDVAGRVLWRSSVEGIAPRIRLSRQDWGGASGTYFVVLQAEGETFTKPVVVK